MADNFFLQVNTIAENLYRPDTKHAQEEMIERYGNIQFWAFSFERLRFLADFPI
jgi:hypothetical protein